MKKQNKIIVLSVCILLCLAVAGGTFAWYLREGVKRAKAEEANVMAPYNLYLLNPNAKDSLQIAVGNLHPGEVKQTVICVSNKIPENYEGDYRSELAKDSEFGYDLMLVHTDNLAVDYKTYPLTEPKNDIPSNPADVIFMADENGDPTGYYWEIAGDLLSGNDVSTTMLDGSPGMREKVFQDQDITDIVNVGTYWLSDDKMELAYHDGSYEYDYYLIEIKWQDDVRNFDAYKKETDLVYVVVNAKQPRPIEEP